MTDSVWQRDDNWVGTAFEDSFVMVHLETGKYIALNPTANAVWVVLEQPRTLDEIAAELTKRFAVEPEHCRESVSKLLDRMRELQLAAPR